MLQNSTEISIYMEEEIEDALLKFFKAQAIINSTAMLVSVSNKFTCAIQKQIITLLHIWKKWK